MSRPKTKELITVKCKWCNNDFEVDPWQFKKGWGKCCSKSCAANLRENPKKETGIFNNWNRDWF